jgi:peptidoglycan/LPS O-acetylase OafA/YrhL
MWCRPRWFALVMLIGIAGPANGRALLWKGGVAYDLYFRTDLRFDNLMWGALVAWLVHVGYAPSERWRSVLTWAAPAAFAAFIGLASMTLFTDGAVYLGVFSVVGLLCAVVIAGTVWAPPSAMNRLFAWEPLRWTGQISYGLYLWHLPAFHAGTYLSSPWARNLMPIIATFAIASLSFYLVERRFLRMKDRIGATTAAGRGPLASISSVLPASVRLQSQGQR